MFPGYLSMNGMIVLISAIVYTEVHALKNRRITAIVLKYASSLCVCWPDWHLLHHGGQRSSHLVLPWDFTQVTFVGGNAQKITLY